MKNIKHVFFDLDHTLWDFEKNSTEAIHELFLSFEFNKVIHSFDEFINAYQQINHAYWHKYNHGLIDKHTVRYGRFVELFKQFKISTNDDVAINFADKYIAIAPHKTHLFEDTHDVLTYLKEKYSLHLITNGFKEVIDIKIDKSDLRKYFNLILSAEDVGVNKPHAKVFNTALEKTEALANESLMIGDSYEADILGAQNVGMHTIFFNPKKDIINSESIEIHYLRQLKSLL